MIACRRAGLALLGLLALTPRVEAAGEYRRVEVESLRITVDSEWVPVTAPGYLPVRWDITNEGMDRTIEIAGDGNRVISRAFWYRQSRTTVRQRIRLAAGDRVRFTMSVPVSGEVDNVRFEIREDGRTLQSVGYFGASRITGVPGSSALIVVAQNGSYAAAAPGWVRTMTMPGRYVPPVAAVPATGTTAAGAVAVPPAPTGPPMDLVLEPARLPASWLGYTSVQTIVIGPREWEALEPAQRGALITWIACGGSLVLVDAGLETLFPDAQRRPAAAGTVAEHFFGRIHLRSAAGIDRDGFAATVSFVEGAVPDPLWALPLQVDATPPSDGFLLPIPGVSAVPAGAYLTVLVLFALLIGPVNQFVLRKRRQQALIVLTTPLIASLFIMLLGGYVALVEGFAVRGRAISLTLLDQPAGQAVTRASASLYAAGRAPSGGLRFGREAGVFPTPSPSAPPSEVLDLSDTQQYASGFLQARTPTNFDTVEWRTARERLTFRRDAGGLRVSNGLGATVTRLLVRQGGRSYEAAEALPPGGTAALRESAATARTLATNSSTGLATGGSTGLATGGSTSLATDDAALARFDSVLADLADGSYVAVLDRSPFWDGGAPGIDERGSVHLVLGRSGGLP